MFSEISDKHGGIYRCRITFLVEQFKCKLKCLRITQYIYLIIVPVPDIYTFRLNCFHWIREHLKVNRTKLSQFVISRKWFKSCKTFAIISVHLNYKQLAYLFPIMLDTEKITGTCKLSFWLSYKVNLAWDTLSWIWQWKYEIV